MTRRVKRVIRFVVVMGLLTTYWQTATWLERRAIAAQQPTIASGAAPRIVDREQLMADVTRLSSAQMEGRRTGSRGGVEARTWIANEFRAIGAQPAGDDGYLQRFAFTHFSIKRLFLPGPAETQYTDAANVLARLEGSVDGAKPIVISAHYDHLGRVGREIFHGADDNASGVAVLLALARHLRTAPLRHRAIVAAFDAEELGLEGAEAFMQSRPEARTAILNINLDMVSRSDRNEIFASGTHHYPQLKPIVHDVQTRARVKVLFGHDRPIYRSGGVDDWTRSSDHAVFHAAGIPFVYFGVEDHPDYHAPSDTADKIDREFFGNVADMIADAVRTFDAHLP